MGWWYWADDLDGGRDEDAPVYVQGTLQGEKELGRGAYGVVCQVQYDPKATASNAGAQGTSSEAAAGGGNGEMVLAAWKRVAGHRDLDSRDATRQEKAQKDVENQYAMLKTEAATLLVLDSDRLVKCLGMCAGGRLTSGTALTRYFRAVASSFTCLMLQAT